MTSAHQRYTHSMGFEGRGPVRTRLAHIRSVPGLLLEIDNPRRSGSSRFAPKVRFATDPARHPYWFGVIHDTRLRQVAERFGHGGRWLRDARDQLRVHRRNAKKLLEALKVEAFDTPWPIETQYAGGGGGAFGEKEPVLKVLSVEEKPKRPRSRKRRRHRSVFLKNEG